MAVIHLHNLHVCNRLVLFAISILFQKNRCKTCVLCATILVFFLTLERAVFLFATYVYVFMWGNNVAVVLPDTGERVSRLPKKRAGWFYTTHDRKPMAILQIGEQACQRWLLHQATKAQQIPSGNWLIKV